MDTRDFFAKRFGIFEPVESDKGGLSMKKITQLEQTVELMSSESYKDRFIAEYTQIEIRTKRLERVLKSIEDKTCPKCFEPTCPVDILTSQLKYMNDYRAILIVRASIEEIELPEVEV